LAESYLATSPYAYVLNNPINMFDPDGRTSEPFNWRESWDATPAGTNSYWFNNGSGFTSYNGGPRGAGGSGLAYGTTINTDGTFTDPNGAGNSKSSLWQALGNLFSSIIKGNKGAGITTFVPGATVTRATTGVLEVGTATFEGIIEGIEGVIEGIEGIAPTLNFKALIMGISRVGVWSLPLLLEGDMQKKEQELTLFRGVHGKHPDLANAYRGMAIPWGGPRTAEEHNFGLNNSMYTSWSTNIHVANYSASRRGPGGVILKQSFPISRLSFYDRHGEGEVQVFGPVVGAKIIKPWNGGTWTPYIK
ncbi:hypothetical protein, partial [Chryseobacterium rhizosphaerae]